MSVPAHTNKFGGFKKNRQYGWLQTAIRISDGSVSFTQGSVSKEINVCRRSGYGVNPVHYIKGVLPWRDNRGYYRKVVNSTWTEGDYGYTSGGYRYEVTGHRYANSDVALWLVGPLKTDEAFYFTDAKNQARVEALLKLASGKVQYGQFLAESVKSANMLAGRLTDLLTLLRHVKHGNLKALKGGFRRSIGSRQIASGSLEIKYGWLPLMTDIYNMFGHSQQTLKPPLMIEGKKSVRSSYRNTQVLPGGTETWRDHVTTCQGHNTCHIYARISDSLVNKAQSMGLINPLSLAWEVVPYSFVIDWAIPVGNYLSALTATAGLTFVDGYENEVREGTMDFSVYRNAINYTYGNNGSCHTEVFALVRTPLGGFPAPMLYGKSPFSTSSVTSAIMLMRQFF